MGHFFATNREFRSRRGADFKDQFGNNRTVKGDVFLFQNTKSRLSPGLGEGVPSPEEFRLIRDAEKGAEKIADACRNEVQFDEATQTWHPHPPMLVVWVHGFNNSVGAAIARGEEILAGLKANGLRPVVLSFSWPSDSSIAGYLPDRHDAKDSAISIAKMMRLLHKMLNPANCEINVNVVAQSMGVLVVREGLNEYSREAGYPEKLFFLNEVAVVASDVDNTSLDFDGPGLGLLSLSRRVTSYSSKHDGTLLASQKLKNSGSARLGRNGPDDFSKLHKRAVSVDCTNVIRPLSSNPIEAARETSYIIHSAYFSNQQFYSDLSRTLLGFDRTVIPTRQLRQGTNPHFSDFVLIEG
jgi:esterase/lipase superfamily enzyme